MYEMNEDSMNKYLDYFRERYGIDNFDDIVREVNKQCSLDISIFVSKPKNQAAGDGEA